MKALFLFISVALFFSCSSDYLELKNPNAIDSQQFFKDKNDIESGISGIYSELQNFPEIFNINLSEVRSNNIEFGISNAQRDQVDISRFNVTSTMNTIEDAWESGYVVIARANKVLEALNDIELDDTEFKRKSEGQALLLRAYAHFCLARVFARVPNIKEVISPLKGLTIPQSELAQTYAFIESDLKEAIEKLDKQYLGESGRATRITAQALLGELYLTWGSYPLKDETKLNLAIQNFESLIDEKGTNSFNWSNRFQDLFLAENNNKFSLFEVQYISGTSGIGALFPTLFLSNNFIDFPFNGGVPRISPSQDLLKSFIETEEDIRYKFTLDTLYTNNFFEQQYGLHIKKWYQKDVIPSLLSRNDWPHNYPIIRPAAIYLMHAEAIVLKNGGTPSQDAITSVNEVRRRAGLTDLNESITNEDFKQVLKREYRHEFVGEGLYWHFLVRTELAVQEINNWYASLNENITITEDKLIYPIPLSQMNIMEGLYQQNPGY